MCAQQEESAGDEAIEQSLMLHRNVGLEDEIDLRASGQLLQIGSVSHGPASVLAELRMLGPAVAVDRKSESLSCRQLRCPGQALLSVQADIQPLEQLRHDLKHQG